MPTTSETTKNKGLAARTTNPQNTHNNKPKFTDNSTQNQCAKLLDYLQGHGSITKAHFYASLPLIYLLILLLAVLGRIVGWFN